MRSRIGGTRRVTSTTPALPTLQIPSGDGSSFGGGSAATAGAPAPPQGVVAKSLQLPLPENDPIPSAIEFEFSGTVSTAAPGVSQIVLDDGSGNPFSLAPGEVARIASVFLIVAGTITVATNQLFTLRNGMAVVRGWSNRRVVPTPSNGYTQPFYAKILVPNGTTLTAEVNNVDGGSYIDGIMLTGWRWSEASGRAWNRGLGQ